MSKPKEKELIMARQYEHPGEVREAKNFRCYHCGAVLQTPQGINGHLHMLHKIPTDNILHGIDWGVTDKIACENSPMPVANRRAI